MSLRRRLLITLGLSLSGVWLLVSGWLLVDLHQTVRHTLDQRLKASARMVSGLMEQMPRNAWQQSFQGAADAPTGQGIACQISSMRGEILLRTQGGHGPTFAHARPGFSEQEHAGRHWRIYTQKHNGLSITVADQLDDRWWLQMGIVMAAVLPFVAALLGSLLLGWWSIRRGLSPLDRLRAELARRNPETLTPVNIKNAPAELEPLIDTLNGLLLRTDEALQREQRFTSNAAHELRTPLTAIKTHVQLARRLSDDSAEPALARAETGVARLQRTLEQLLLLARVESSQARDFGDCLAYAGPTIQAVSQDLGLSEEFAAAYKQDETPLALPEELAVVALRNLLDNALQHSSAVETVQLCVQRQDRQMEFTVTDAGQVEAIPEPARFERGASSQGSGLGLSIVLAIAQRFGGQLHLERRQPQGLCARLLLPIAS